VLYYQRTYVPDDCTSVKTVSPWISQTPDRQSRISTNRVSSLSRLCIHECRYGDTNQIRCLVAIKETLIDDSHATKDVPSAKSDFRVKKMVIDNSEFKISPKFAVIDNQFVISEHSVSLTENL
jgi:hypothetical protein